MSSPVLPKSVNVNSIKYSEVKVLKSGAKTVYTNYSTGKLRIQTPVMYLPYGVNEGGYEDKNAKPDPTKVEKKDKKFDITLSFKGHEENSKIADFLNKVKEIETKIIDDAYEYRQAWFKDDFDNNKAILARLFSPNIKVDKDKTTGKVVGKYPPTIRFKLPYDNENDKFNFNSYNMNGEAIDLLDIITKLKGGKAQLIVELNSIWFAGGKFGCTWKLITGKFQRSITNDCNFIDDSDTEKIKDDDEEEDDDDDKETKEAVSSLNETTVENSDVEGEEYTEEQTEKKVEEVAPVEKKKGRTAKK
jgi:ribosomal protein S17E